ncbi:MAG: YihY/virulence factor BrkB family protein, partial [Rhodoferax sp.]|nr:YihY/virulence factor BrkB family protein [Rhodoferax sp.]
MRAWDFLDRWLFGPLSLSPRPAGRVLRVLRYPYAVLRDLSQGQLNLRAMGLVYATFLSIVPLLAFSFAILKGFGAHRDLEPVIYEFFRPIGAAATEITARIMQFADNVSTGIVGSVGFALLLWTLIGTIRKVEDSFNFVWHVEQPRSFARRITEYVSLLIIGPLLLVAFLGLAHRALRSDSWQAIAQLPLLSRALGFTTGLEPYVMVTAIFTLMYMFVPNTRVRWRPALIGGVTGGVLWAAVGTMFTAFVVYSSRLTIVYAGLAIIVATLLWTYFGWLILLIGAQLSFYVQNPEYLRIGLRELRLSSVEVERVSLKVMYLVGRSHAAGAAVWTVSSLSAELGLPGIAVAQLVATLEKAGLLLATDDERLLPGRDIGRIRLQDILDAARNQKNGHAPARDLSLPPVDRLTRALD